MRFSLKQLGSIAMAMLVYAAQESSAEDMAVTEEHPEVLKQIDVAPVWSVHRTGTPYLLTRDGRQYVAYYDADRFLTLAQRTLGSENWTFRRFPVQVGWQTGGHARLTLALDRDGYVHLNCYRRGLLQAPPRPPAAIYYRSLEPHSIEAFERLYMISEREHPHYPTFYRADDTVFFAYRSGGSGRGDQWVNRYNTEERTWERAFDTPLLDGRRRMNAYVHGPGGPVVGPDGRWHLLWLWRNTPCHSTNHSLSYARTVGRELTQWESADGTSVSPPFSIDNRELLVADLPPGRGLSNVLHTLNWDSMNRAVISFHAFDDAGKSQIYNARFEDGEWLIVPATRWSYVWGDDYRGTGALGISSHVRMSRVQPVDDGTLTQSVWNRDIGQEHLLIDEDTLQFIRRTEPPSQPDWRRAMLRPESDFPVAAIPRLRRSGGAMQVMLISDTDGRDLDGVQYLLRWEHAGTNNDRPVPKPWPEPTILRVYKIRAVE